MRPVLVDLFCGAGGSAVGYHRAGFDVVGIDHRPQPRYPFTFVQADALEWLRDAGLSPYSAIHASPPCQGYSRLRHLPWLRDREYPMLIGPTRRALESTGLPWVVENVEDAPLMQAPGLFGIHGIVLCGQMFGLPIYRHRSFESNVVLGAPSHPRHTKQGRGRRLNQRRSQRTEILTIAGHSTGWPLTAQRAAMGIDWMSREELTQAIPPAYTHFIGEQLLAAVRERVS
jgi:DNA (cytosine-5)-methyltransferase 1